MRVSRNEELTDNVTELVSVSVREGSSLSEAVNAAVFVSDSSSLGDVVGT